MQDRELSGKRIYEAMGQGLATALLGPLSAMAMARLMRFSEFGEFASARGVLSIGAVLCSLGMGALARKLYRGNLDAASASKARGMRIAGPVLILLVCLSTYLSLVVFHARVHHETAVRLEIFATVLSLLPMLCLRSFFRASAGAHGAAVAANSLNGWAARVFFLLILGIAVSFLGSPLGVLTIAALWATSSFVVLTSLWILLLRVEPAYLRKGYRAYEVGGWVRAGMAFALASLGLTIIDHGGVVVLGWVHANAGAAARFSAAASVGITLFAIATSVRAVFVPVLVEAVLKRDAKSVRAIFRRWFTLVAGPLAAVALVLLMLAPWLLKFFGAKFEDSYWTLILFVFDYFLAALNILGLSLYQYSGHERRAMVIMVAFALMGVVGMVVVGPFWQEFGVALVSAIALNLALLLMVALGWRELRSWERTEAA